MRIITVQQPWAWAIFHGKTVENRSSNLAGAYRGPLAIHAGKRWSDRGAESPLVVRAAYSLRPGGPAVSAAIGGPSFVLEREFAQGVILGTVNLVDAHPDHDDCCASPWAESSYVEHSGRERQHIWHLVFADPVEFDVPVPAVGGLGMRKVQDPNVLAALAAAA